MTLNELERSLEQSKARAARITARFEKGRARRLGGTSTGECWSFAYGRPNRVTLEVWKKGAEVVRLARAKGLENEVALALKTLREAGWTPQKGCE
jgi:hypothetical protein